MQDLGNIHINASHRKEMERQNSLRGSLLQP
jgi:hypothetical protein